eukprot:2485481-Heterocapsa_arctica.AAC.1
MNVYVAAARAGPQAAALNRKTRVRPDADQLGTDEVGVADVVVQDAELADEASDVGLDNLLDEELLRVCHHGHQLGGHEARALRYSVAASGSSA